MKVIGKIPEAAMVGAFLKAELRSARFSGELKKAMSLIGVSEAQIIKPDFSSVSDNELRARVLGEYRGYRQNREMFEDIPDDLVWYEAALSREDIGNLHYVDYSYWNELTDNTHLVKDGVANIRKGKVVFDVPHDRFLTVANDIRRGKYDFEPMILWGKTLDSPLTILEGHLRATAFGLAADEGPATIPVIVGLEKALNIHDDSSNKLHIS